jgi:hypothetical protein
MIIALSTLIAFLVICLLGLVGYTTYTEQHKVHRKTSRKSPNKEIPNIEPNKDNSKSY